jgi:hypothetical protein
VKIVVPVVVLFVAWYAFRPERLIVNQRVQEKFPAETSSSNLQALEFGNFHSIMHPTQGTATIFRACDGSRVLRFTNFSTSNGPDVNIYMVAANDANDAATVLHAGFIDLGPIKGNFGDQNYTLGSDVD